MHDRAVASQDNFYRTYDPGTGRYLTADPIGQGGGINVYVYALNSPVVLSDPNGLRVSARVPLIGGASGRLRVNPNCACVDLSQLNAKDEDANGEGSLRPAPGPGVIVDADGVYSPTGVIKIPDNYDCEVDCAGGQIQLTCHWRWPAPAWRFPPVRVPEYFPPGADLPRGFPRNPFGPRAR